MSSLLGSLRLDQKEAYISISATNEEGYDRWLSFYLSLPDDGEALSDKELENKLREEISTLSLYDKDGLVYTADELLWAAVQTDTLNYSILVSDDAEEIESVTLVYEYGFAGITDVSITQTEKKGNEISHEATVSFHQKETGIAFRPFLKIKTVSGKEGLLVPPTAPLCPQLHLIIMCTRNLFIISKSNPLCIKVRISLSL